MKILIVEDLKVMRRVIANTVNGLGFTKVLESEDGIDALFVIQSEKVDFIITDWLMPNMDGLELVKDIRRDERYKETPILMITSVDDKENVVQALKAGIDDYIAKPFKPELLRKKVERLLAKFNIKSD